MKKRIKKILAAVWLSALLLAVAAGAAACDTDTTDGAPVFVKIEMTAAPTVTEYTAGDAFDPAGGKISAVYSDRSKLEMELTAEGVTLSAVDTATPGAKRVNVTYNGDSTSFLIRVLPVAAEPDLPDPDEGDTVIENVARIQIRSNPAQTEYFVGDAFDPAGGVITVTYGDRTTEEMSLTASGVTVDPVDTSAPGAKTVTVRCGGRRTTFTVTVVELGGIVTFDHNYAGDTDDKVRVAVNRTFAEPVSAPVRGGYTFRGWYEDATCTVPFEFGRNVVTEDISVYASWTDDALPAYKVTYDLNYYGVRRADFVQYVRSGDAARPLYGPYNAPSRREYAFGGWFADKACTVAYDGRSITADTVIYAQWTKNKTASAYTFEAENVDLSGMTGPGFSGEASGADMIVEDATLGASGNRFVSYLYKEGLTLRFRIAAGEADDNATIGFSIAADSELGVDIALNPDNYQIRVNGEVMRYAAVTLPTAGARFTDAITLTGVRLAEGNNIIEMVTNNSVNPVGAGTYAGTAPMVDCIKVTTEAVLMWDENYGLPANA